MAVEGFCEVPASVNSLLMLLTVMPSLNSHIIPMGVVKDVQILFLQGTAIISSHRHQLVENHLRAKYPQDTVMASRHLQLMVSVQTIQ